MLKIREESHDCKLPSMIERYEDQTFTKGFWPFKRKYTQLMPVYFNNEADYVCEECESKWSYSPNLRWIRLYCVETYKEVPESTLDN